MPKTGLFAAKTLEHRKRLLSRIRHFRREIGNGTVLHALSLAVMTQAGSLPLRRSSAPVRRARPASVFCARPPNLPCVDLYRCASQPSLPSGRCLPTSPVRPSAPPAQAPTARASRTSRTFSRQARCQTRMQGSDPAWREGAQSLCTSRTQRKRNRTTYLSSFPKKTSPSRRTRLREAESRRRLKL